MYTVHDLEFFNTVLFEFYSERFQVYVRLRPSLSLFFPDIYLFISVMPFLFSHFTPKLHASLGSDCWFVLVYCCLFLGRIFFHYFGMSRFIWIGWPYFCIVLLSLLSSISFDLFFSNCIVRFTYCFVKLVLFLHNAVYVFFFLRTFACRSFFIYLSSQIYYPCSVFLFEFLGRTPIISQTSFVLE